MGSDPDFGPLPLGYTKRWISLGVTTLSDIRADEKALQTSDDKSPEHFRWATFLRFFERLDSMSPELAEGLFALGTDDPDGPMGGSIRAAVLRHSQCPRHLLELALRSPERHLNRIASKRLGQSRS